MYSYLYTLKVTADKCNIARIASLELPAADVTADVYYRLRRGVLNVAIDGTTDGIWLDVFPGPLASAYWEDMNFKVWATIRTPGETTGPPSPPGVIGTLFTPVYHNWNGEVNDAQPSFVEPNPVDGDTMVINPNNPVGWTDCIEGVTSGTSEIAIIDLGGTFGSGDSGVRVQWFSRTAGTAAAYIEAHLSDSPDTLWPVGGNYLYWRIQENTNPDEFTHIRRIDGTEDFNETYTDATNNATGNIWNYYRFEQLADGNTTWSVYDAAGALEHTHTRAYQGTNGILPKNMQYLTVRGVNGGSNEVCQMWAGTTDDSWPSLPMVPMTNL
jgi:hypothetical protein